MLTAFLVLAVFTIVVGLFVRLNRHHERAMTKLHAAFDEEVRGLRAEMAGIRLTREAPNGR